MSNENHKIEVRDLRHGEWLWTHKAILFSPYIPDSAFKVYCGLASYAGNVDQKSWPSLITLASKLHLSKSTVVRSLKLLELCGAIGVERRDGQSNMYSLLKVDDIKPPAVKKNQSSHHKLVDHFYRASLYFRRVKPQFGGRDVAALKRALAHDIVTEQQVEQMMIYFLASPSFKKFTPSLSTFFSSGIITGLMNQMQNGETFWKDLDRWAMQFYQQQQGTLIPVAAPKIEQGEMRSMAEAMKSLATRMTMPGSRERETAGAL